jgi:hypothetical protein
MLHSTPTTPHKFKKVEMNTDVFEIIHEDNSAVDDSLFKCDFCEVGFKSKSGKRRHIDAKHKGIRFKCLKCEELFNTKYHCQRHLLSVHQSTEESYEKMNISE